MIRSYVNPLFVAGLGLLAGCAATARPTPPPALPVSARAEPAPTTQPTTPAEAPPPPTGGPPPAPGRPPIPWLNPARCLSPCAFDPGPELVRVNRQGVLDEHGRFATTAEAQVALLGLLQAAHQAGHELRIESAYRSYAEQARVFSEIKEAGRAARPGHSEHQLGTVIDLRLPTGAAIAWLAEHAHELGFSLSYPPGKQKLTGYRPEPWHVRYVGRELAAELHDKGQILEEHFRAEPALGMSGTCGDCPLPASHAPCGAATAAGTCSGTVLLWCYDGALAQVDCAVSGQQCGPVGDAGEHDCLPKPADR